MPHSALTKIIYWLIKVRIRCSSSVHSFLTCGLARRKCGPEYRPSAKQDSYSHHIDMCILLAMPDMHVIIALGI